MEGLKSWDSTPRFWFLFTPREQKTLQLFWVAFSCCWLWIVWRVLLSDLGKCQDSKLESKLTKCNSAAMNGTVSPSPAPQILCWIFSICLHGRINELHLESLALKGRLNVLVYIFDVPGFIVITLHFQWGGFRPLSNSCTTRDQKAISCPGSSTLPLLGPTVAGSGSIPEISPWSPGPRRCYFGSHHV